MRIERLFLLLVCTMLAYGESRFPVLAKDIHPSRTSDVAELTVAGDYLYFAARHPTVAHELCKYNGTNVSVAANVDSLVFQSYPKELAVIGDTVYFLAKQPSKGIDYRPFRTDGTTATASHYSFSKAIL